MKKKTFYILLLLSIVTNTLFATTVNCDNINPNDYLRKTEVLNELKTLGSKIVEKTSLSDNDMLLLSNTITEQIKATGLWNYIKGKITEIFIPIGTIYETANASFNPATTWGGTWTKITGRVLVGLDTSQTEFNTIGKTGGAKTHVLTVGEMASHNHGGITSSETIGMYYDSYGNFGSGNGWVWKTSDSPNKSSSTKCCQDSHSHTIQTNGSNLAHNNLQPYRVVVMWERTN